MAFPAPQNHFWAQHHSILLELLLPQLTAARDLVRLAQTCKAARGVLREERVASLWLRRARFGADANATDAVAAETAWTQIQRRAALERLGARRGTLLPDDPHEYCDCRTLLPPAEERPQPWDICAVGGYVAALDENGDLTLYDPARDRDPRVGEIALHGELVPDADYQGGNHAQELRLSRVAPNYLAATGNGRALVWKVSDVSGTATGMLRTRFHRCPAPATVYEPPWAPRDTSGVTYAVGERVVLWSKDEDEEYSAEFHSGTDFDYECLGLCAIRASGRPFFVGVFNNAIRVWAPSPAVGSAAYAARLSQIQARTADDEVGAHDEELRRSTLEAELVRSEAQEEQDSHRGYYRAIAAAAARDVFVCAARDPLACNVVEVYRYDAEQRAVVALSSIQVDMGPLDADFLYDNKDDWHYRGRAYPWRDNDNDDQDWDPLDRLASQGTLVVAAASQNYEFYEQDVRQYHCRSRMDCLDVTQGGDVKRMSLFAFPDQLIWAQPVVSDGLVVCGITETNNSLGTIVVCDPRAGSLVTRTPVDDVYMGYHATWATFLAVTCRHVVIATEHSGHLNDGQKGHGLWCYDLFADAARDGAAALRETAAPDPFA